MSEEFRKTRLLDPAPARISGIGPHTILSGRYRLDLELGRGGMGVVYRATDLELRREVAVKVLPDIASTADARERLLREARAAAALNHHHIVAVHDVGEYQGTPFFVMELVQGKSLNEIRPRDIARVVEIACQICEALSHAHENSIIHRDLKPDNILLKEGGGSSSVKVADLGLALPVQDSRLSHAGLVIGTPAYMAPEQALGQTVDGRADLYALGVLLYELLTGRPPFVAEDPLSMISQHVHASVVPPRTLRPDLPRALEAVILRLLAKDPGQRFATAVETNEALRKALEASDPEVEEESVSAVAILDALSRGRLIGRSEELAEARELWRRARDGRGHSVLLSGEPGAGKTRLAREIVVQAALDGAVVLSGGCYEYEATTPYLPFVEAIRRWIRDQTDDNTLRNMLGDSAPQISKLAPEIMTRLGPFPDRLELAPHEDRLLFFEAVAKVLRKLADARGLALYLDDLHWADSSSLWLLGHLLRALRELKVLIVGAYRETELDRAHPLAKALVDWNRERLTTRIALRRFGREETRAQLGALLCEDVGGEFANAIHRETEGNPFFVEEVLKALIEQGSVRRESGRWKRCEIGELLIPQSIKEAIANRLDRVSADCNEVLRAAAVLGKTFSFDELLAVVGSDRDEDALLDALDEATAAQLLISQGNEAFAFTHDKIREVLYEELNPIRRRRLHRRTAEGLERCHKKAAVPVERLAHHYIEAGDHERGLEYAKLAANEAVKIFAFDEAITVYGRALECAEALELFAEQALLEEAMGETSMLAGNMLPASEHFEKALALVDELAHRARLQCRAASSLVTNGDPRGLVYVQQALTVLDPQTQPIETANALCIEGRFHHLAGRHRKAIELMENAARLVDRVAESATLSTMEASTISIIYAYLAGAHQHLGLFIDSDQWSRRAIEFGVTHGVPLAQAMGYEFLGENAVNTGAWKEGLEYAALEREIAGRMHSRERTAWSHFVSSTCAMLLGDIQYAESEFNEGIALSQSLGERRLTVLLKGWFAMLQANVGRLDEALKAAKENLEAAETLGFIYMRTEGRHCLAHVHFRRGELYEVIRLCEEVLELTAPTESCVSRLWMGPLHIESLLGLERRKEANERLKIYAELVNKCQSPFFGEEVVRLRGLL